MLDRFLVGLASYKLPIILCINKIDKKHKKSEAERIKSIYAPLGYDVIFTSAKSRDGFSDLKELLKNNISVFAGLSGVGKSSILNSFKEGLNLKVDEVSAKIKRGKNTTRFVELIDIGENTWIVDTPGFSLVKHDIASGDLHKYFPEIKKLEHICKFSDCLHIHEPECKVKEALESETMFSSRYESYKKLLLEQQEKERTKYK